MSAVVKLHVVAPFLFVKPRFINKGNKRSRATKLRRSYKNKMSSVINYSKRDPGEKECAESAESLEHLMIPKLLDRWVRNTSEDQRVEMVPRDQQQEHLQELKSFHTKLGQTALSRKNHGEPKPAKQLAALKTDSEHLIVEQNESNTKWLQEVEDMHLHPHEYSNSSTTLTSMIYPTASSFLTVMENAMVSVPIANIIGGLNARFSQFSKGISTAVLPQQQQMLGPFTEHAEAQAQTPAAVIVPEPDAPVTDEPLALLSYQKTAAEADDPKLNILIRNVVCSFNVGCQLDLRDIAQRGFNVIYHKNRNLTMKLRRPAATAFLWSSGRINCTGATSEILAKVASRRFARCLGKLGFPTRFQNFRIATVLGTCRMPWDINIANFSKKHPENAKHDPEMHWCVTYQMQMPKAALKIFTTGSITVMAASVNLVESAIEHIYPLIREFRKQRSLDMVKNLRAKKKKNGASITTASTTTDPSKARALEEKIFIQSQMQSRSDIMMNATAAHAKTIPKSAASELANAPYRSVERLRQIEAYREMSKQTREERRHIPFPRDTSEAKLFPYSGPRKSLMDNINANARRRANKFWASKIKKKSPRSNDHSFAERSPSSNPAIQSTSSTSVTSKSDQILPSSSPPATQSTGSTSVTSKSDQILPPFSLPIISDEIITAAGTIKIEW
ncbi:uncharacterized protein LOC108157711 [Drosophila miranda]|uniref:uncharacterized protein LOC108157711 n=1 Tax=Drosophila miranda TaxID=7229 RepID=UPI00143F2AA8|nr:uncharacterized protein LOC108157711 [Drosophila miranda]